MAKSYEQNAQFQLQHTVRCEKKKKKKIMKNTTNYEDMRVSFKKKKKKKINHLVSFTTLIHFRIQQRSSQCILFLLLPNGLRYYEGSTY